MLRNIYDALMSTEEQKPKAFGYIRVSTNEEKQALGTESQRQKIVDYCKKNGLDLIEIVIDEISGGRKFTMRESNSKIQKMVEKGVKHLVSLKLDRLFRVASDGLNQFEAWDKVGLKVHLVDMKIDTSEMIGKFMLTQFLAVAELERSTIKNRIVSALEVKKKRGEALGRWRTFGFDIVEGKIQVNEEELKILEDAIERIESRQTTQTKVAEEFNQRGIKPVRGGKWNQAMISKTFSKFREIRGRLARVES